MRSGQADAVTESEEAGPDLVYTGAEDQRVRGDDGGDVGAGDAGAGEQGEDGVGVGGGVEAGAPKLLEWFPGISGVWMPLRTLAWTPCGLAVG